MLFTLLGYYLFNELGMDVLQVIGTLVLAAVALRILGSVYKYFLRPGKNLTKYGKWAVITGATDGIVRSLAPVCVGWGRCWRPSPAPPVHAAHLFFHHAN